MKRGFTLIELMVVIVILGILAGIIVPRFLGREEEAKQIAALVQIKNFESALDLFKLDNGFYPSTEQGLRALVEKPTVGDIPDHWKEGGYLREIPLDPWDYEYVYLSPGIHNRDYDIMSLGRDGEEGGEGTDADVGNWQMER